MGVRYEYFYVRIDMFFFFGFIGIVYVLKLNVFGKKMFENFRYKRFEIC